MTRWNQRQIAHKLAEPPAAEPPADLLERLLEDIPDSPPVAEPTEAKPEGDESKPDGTPLPQRPSRPSRRGWSPRWLAAAAVLLMMVGGGLLTVHLQRQGLSPDTSVFDGAAAPAAEARSDQQTAAESPAEAEEASFADRESLQAEDELKKIPMPASEDDAAPDAGTSAAAESELDLSDADLPDADLLIDQPAPQDAPEPSEAEPTAESPEDLRTEKARRMRERIRELRAQASARSKESVAARPQSGEAPSPPPAPPAPPPAPRAKVRPPAESSSIPKPRLEEPQRQLGTFNGSSAQPRGTAGGTTGGTAEPNDEPYGDVFFESAGTSPFIDTEDDALSTFGLDVDTASYTVVRRYLRDGHLPPRDAVRVEELINYFDYGEAPPRREDFALLAEGAPAIFAQGARYRLVRFHLQAREVRAAARKPAVLVLVVDVSGSMDQENRLGLVRRSLDKLLGQLEEKDRIGLVIFGDEARAVLEPTADRRRVRDAIESLVPQGSTNAEAGLMLGYEMLRRHHRDGAIHRVVLCSDGVANVGETAAERILERVGEEARKGLELTTLGFGMGNYNDVLMEKLADRGNGRYAYIDSLEEAHRVLVEELTGTLQTVASDARVQVEFNPQAVERYRLLGYENRDLADHRFRDNRADAGEIGAGHGVTALYEIKLTPRLVADDAPRRAHLATLRLRYRSAETGSFEELAQPVGLEDLAPTWEQASPSLRLAVLVAEFAEILRGSWWAKEGSLDEVFRRAQQVSAELPGNAQAAEFAALAGRAAGIRARAAQGEE
ncbi:MAG: von Willebrand factor type A domain-containing protein [Acidobacteriota bacterium]|nr:von Willebrand factor type A domain-containing protein [Acidobacteriota bacterium]